jgi:hypothetical protein
VTAPQPVPADGERKDPLFPSQAEREAFENFDPNADPVPADGDAKRLSQLLWAARETIEMWADTVEARTGKPDNFNRGLVSRIDAYRAERGWSPDGFSGELS